MDREKLVEGASLKVGWEEGTRSLAWDGLILRCLVRGPDTHVRSALKGLKELAWGLRLVREESQESLHSLEPGRQRDNERKATSDDQ